MAVYRALEPMPLEDSEALDGDVSTEIIIETDDETGSPLL